jgi:hypothetical protein
MAAQTGCWKSGRACPLCPGISDVNLFRYCQGIIYFDAEISDSAFDLGVAEQKLDSPEIARAPVDQRGFRASQRVRPEQSWSDPTLPIHSETRRAYWRVVMLVSGPRRPVNKNSPGLLLAAFR